MKQPSMTALVSTFARAYHAAHSTTPIFNDTLAKALLYPGEYQMIAQHMLQGRAFFNITNEGEEALRRIVDEYLSPALLGRAAYAESALKNAVRIGARRYLILGAGYDTFAYRQPTWAAPLQVVEVDQSAIIEDKHRRLQAARIAIPDNAQFIAADLSRPKDWRTLGHLPALSSKVPTLCSLLGLTYYLPQPALAALLKLLNDLLPPGSSLVFDYPLPAYIQGTGSAKQAALAQAAGEKMQAAYTYEEIEALLAQYHFLVYEHLSAKALTDQYMNTYNSANPAHPIAAPTNVCYCLAVRAQ